MDDFTFKDCNKIVEEKIIESLGLSPSIFSEEKFNFSSVTEEAIEKWTKNVNAKVDTLFIDSILPSFMREEEKPPKRRSERSKRLLK